MNKNICQLLSNGFFIQKLRNRTRRLKQLFLFYKFNKYSVNKIKNNYYTKFSALISNFPEKKLSSFGNSEYYTINTLQHTAKCIIYILLNVNESR